MGTLALIRRSLIGLVATVLGIACLVVVANAGGVPSRIRVHDADETLRNFCRTDAEGRMWLQVPSGARFELVTSVDDPVIANPGDGTFHPFDAAQVHDAIAEVRYPLDGITADVFILPFPRRSGLES